MKTQHRKLLWPIMAIALILTVGFMNYNGISKETQPEKTTSAYAIADIPSKVSIERKEGYKLDDAEYKTSVAPSSIPSSAVSLFIGVSLLGIFTILINLFSKQKTYIAASVTLVASVIALLCFPSDGAMALAMAAPIIVTKNDIQHLLDKRAKVQYQMEDALRKLKDPKAEVTPEETNQFENWDKEFNELTRQINLATKFEQERANRNAIRENIVEETAKVVKDVSASRRKQIWEKAQKFGVDKLSADEQKTVEVIQEQNEALASYIRYGLGNLTPEEEKVLKSLYVGFEGRQNVQTRAQGLTTTAGGYTVPEGFMAEIEKYLKYYGGILEAARVITTQGGADMPWPNNDDTGNKGRLLTEGSDASSGATDLTFGVTTLKAYNYTSDLIKVARVLLQDTGINLEAYMGEALGERLGRILNEHCTTGDNTNKPQGVVSGATSGKVSASASAFTRSEIVDLIHSVDRAYRQSSKAGFMLHDSVLGSIKKLTIGQGTYDDRPLWQPSIIAGEPDRLEGFQYWVNNDMASTLATGNKVLLFGDFNKYIVRMIQGLEILRLNERYAESHQVAFVGFMRFDGRIVNSSAIKYLELT